MELITNHRILQNPERICPPEIFEQIVAVRVVYLSLSGNIKDGIIEIHRDLVSDVRIIFQFMLDHRFPLGLVRPIALFEWSDPLSMAANNTSAFNYRMIDGKDELSWHAYGRAIDINPFLNPCIQNGIITPPGAGYVPSRPGTLSVKSRVTLRFKELGWIWGGDWTSPWDPQHFQKIA
jgi:peptidoglycan L-alanyl-D-glutamate endopeptidase CwlK